MNTHKTHTPGPWKENSDSDIATVLSHPYAIVALGVIVADVTDVPEQEANARLIAAAPDLLEALTDLYAAVARLMLDDPTHHEIADKTAAAGLKAHAAIAKARGPSQ